MTPERKRLYSNVLYFSSNPFLKMWRYLQPDKFEWLIKNSALYLAKASRFKDPLEGIIPELSLQLIKKFEESIGMIHDRAKWIEIMQNFRDSTYVNCWHINEDETARMWKEYCPVRKDDEGENIFEGVVIETTYQQLDNACDEPPEKYFLTIVKYIKDIVKKYIKQGNSLHLFAHKDESFIDEKEGRIISIGNVNEDHLEMEINLDMVINAIYVHPCASQEYYGSVEKFLKEHSPSLVAKLKWSSLRGKVDCKEFG